MTEQLRTIGLAMPYKLGMVNCCLLQTENGFFLIDSGCRNQRQTLEKELQSAGCQPGDLKLVLLTHGDFDHSGNAAYLREQYGAKIAMHAADVDMLQDGNMFANRKKGNLILNKLSAWMFGFGKEECCTPDLIIGDGEDLNPYGLDARVISLPGHSAGSVGVLSCAGDLFCGDLLENRGKPCLNSIMDDPAAAQMSVQKLREMKIRNVYPGHGNPFRLPEVTLFDE